MEWYLFKHRVKFIFTFSDNFGIISLHSVHKID